MSIDRRLAHQDEREIYERLEDLRRRSDKTRREMEEILRKLKAEEEAAGL